MKKLLVLLTLLTMTSTSYATPTVYGKFKMELRDNAKGANTGTTVDSVSTRFGVKGSEKLSGELSTFYKIEFGVNPDSSTSNIKARNQYVGLKGSFGSILMGRKDTPLKNAKPYDFFKDGILDTKNVTNIGFGNTDGGEDRLPNMLAYSTQKYKNSTLEFAFMPSEDGTSKSKLDNQYSIAAKYGTIKKGLFLALAYNDSDSTTAKGSMYRASVQYVAKNGITASYMYQESDLVNKEGSTSIFAVAYKVSNIRVKSKYSQNKEKKNSGLNGDVIGLGVDFMLGKKTTSYIDYGMYDDKFAGTSYNAVSLGLVHVF